MTNELLYQLDELSSPLKPDIEDNFNRLIRGSTIDSTEMVFIRKDLSRTQLAEKRRRQAKTKPNTVLQGLGTLQVAFAREMVKQKDDEALAKARQLVEAADKNSNYSTINGFQRPQRKPEHGELTRHYSHVKFMKMASLYVT